MLFVCDYIHEALSMRCKQCQSTVLVENGFVRNQHPLEVTGRKLRGMMSWLSESKNVERDKKLGFISESGTK